MTLRFHQSVGLVGPDGRDLRAEPEMRISRARVLSPEEARALRGDLSHGHHLAEGAFISAVPAWGFRPAAGPAGVGPEVPQKRMRMPELPSWLEGQFRPRGLSPLGRDFLSRLSPDRVAATGGVSPLLEGRWESLEQRMAYLSQKYLGLDLLRRGLVVEADGRFWPRALAREAELEALRSTIRRRELRDSGSPMSPDEALVWLAAYREAAWDQMRALHPQDLRGTDALVQVLLDQGLAEERRVQMGKGTLGTLRLSPRGLEAFKSLPGAEEFIRRGFGPRKTGRGIGELHEQAVGDGIGYFGHEVQTLGGKVTGLTLDPGLRREYLGSEHCPDLRVEYEIGGLAAQWDIEVVGTHRGDYSHQNVASKTAGSTMRAFNPTSRTGSSRQRDVQVPR